MDFVSPLGPIYQAGTLSGNPLAMAAGIAMLKHLKENPSIYQHVQNSTTSLVDGIRKQLHNAGLKFTLNNVGSMFTLFFTGEHVIDFDTAKTSDTRLFATYFQSMLQQGVYLAPSQFEAMFVSSAIDDKVVGHILDASQIALKALN
jgi:glutamate-1-semialdehyde 2,1-aminomutase